MSLEVRDRRLGAVVGERADFERIAGGCKFTEGPLWHARGAYLLWSDMPDDHIRRWSAAEGVRTFRKPCNMANGLAWDREGRLLACEHASSRVTRTEADGGIVALATHHRGKQLNSPNDIVCGPGGAIHFTDPTYGRMEYYGVRREPELGYRGVYRVGPDARSPVLLAEDFAQPNGLCFSRDGRRLFVNDTERGHIRVFRVGGDGALSGGEVWAQTSGEGQGAPDGMKIDSEGNLYCCGPGGIHVFDPAGACLGVVRTPETAANFAWGDADLKSLYITASSSVYRIRTAVPGLAAG